MPQLPWDDEPLSEIRYDLEEENPLSEYVIRYILCILGYSPKRADGGTLDLYYGNDDRSEQAAISINRDSSHILRRESLNGATTNHSESDHIPFDFINAVSSLVTDSVNKGLSPHALDDHGRLKQEESFQGRNKCEKIPLANVYVEDLRDQIRSRTGKAGVPLWPQGRRCAIVISHDVDHPDKYAGIKAPIFSHHLKIKSNILNNIRRLGLMIKRKFDSNPRGYWQFSPIMDYELARGVNSTFFIASVNKYAPGGTDLDVGYDLRSQEFLDVMSEMNARGFEIGLHASYLAFEDPAELLSQKKELSRLSGQEVKGLRHHYWHLGPDVERTFRHHEDSGFAYDSSLVFNDRIGFRRNIALPFFPWDPLRTRPIDVLQIPVFCMDGSLFYHGMSVDEAVEKVISYVSTIKKYRGVGAIDWHVRASYPGNKEYENWGKAYLRILDWLSTDKEIWTTNAGTVEEWIRNHFETLSLRKSLP